MYRHPVRKTESIARRPPAPPPVQKQPQRPPQAGAGPQGAGVQPPREQSTLSGEHQASADHREQPVVDGVASWAQTRPTVGANENLFRPGGGGDNGAGIEATHADGTTYKATMKGDKLEALSETSKDGKTTQWSQKDGLWNSDEQPPRTRLSMSMDREGTLKYENLDGERHTRRKDGTREASLDGTTRAYDAQDHLRKVTAPSGQSRGFDYDDKGAVKSITDQDKSGAHTWNRAQGDNWSDGKNTVQIPDVKVGEDGAIDYKRGDGRVREKVDGTRIELDSSQRPTRVVSPNGSSRAFTYDDNGVNSITDTVKTGDKTKSETWNRQGSSHDFVRKTDDGKTQTRTLQGEPDQNGDYWYSGADKQVKNARASDLARRTAGGASESVQDASDQLLEAAKGAGINAERFQGYLTDFQKNAQKYGTKSENQVKALDNLRELLTSPASSNLYSPEERNTIAETAMHNMARPMEIDQGYHPTCNVTTLEVYAAARHPEEYSRMVKEIGLTGRYKTNNGTTVTPPRNALRPGEDERTYSLDKPNTEKRNLASQVVQMTLINGLYETGGVQRNGRADTNTRYVLDKVTWQDIGGGARAKIGEDRLADVNGRPKEAKDGGPGFTTGEILGASKMMLGYEMPYVGSPTSMDGGRTWQYDLVSAERLEAAKAKNQFPMGVPTMGGAHVQTIHDVSRDSKGNLWVLLDNQHGEKKDGWVQLSDIHRTEKTGVELEPSIRRWQRPPE